MSNFRLLDDHVKHYKTLTDAQINRLLQTALDVECLFSLICKEEDADSKHICFFLFKLLRKSILNSCSPSVEGHLGKPPFEEPSITKVFLTFTYTRSRFSNFLLFFRQLLTLYSINMVNQAIVNCIICLKLENCSYIV